MNDTVRKEISLPQSREQVWRALSTSEALADWMYPNDFEPRSGHCFTFRVPPNPAVGFPGLTVNCEVLICEPPALLVFSWKVGGPVANTRVTFRLESEGSGTRLYFEHTGFDLTQPMADQAVRGARYGWALMFDRLAVVAANRASA